MLAEVVVVVAVCFLSFVHLIISHQIDLNQLANNMTKKIAKRDAIDFYYESQTMEDKTAGIWTCKKCKEKKKCKSGYSNLYHHLECCIGMDYLASLQTFMDTQVRTTSSRISKKQAALDSFFIGSPKEMRACTWIKWICCRNMPISEIDNPITRKFAGVEAFNSKTIRKYILNTATLTIVLAKSLLHDAFPLFQIGILSARWCRFFANTGNKIFWMFKKGLGRTRIVVVFIIDVLGINGSRRNSVTDVGIAIVGIVDHYYFGKR